MVRAKAGKRRRGPRRRSLTRCWYFKVMNIQPGHVFIDDSAGAIRGSGPVSANVSQEKTAAGRGSPHT